MRTHLVVQPAIKLSSSVFAKSENLMYSNIPSHANIIRNRFWNVDTWIILGPLSIDRFPEVDDDVEVDVEQCSDSEALARSRTPRAATNSSRATPTSDDERLTPEPVRENFIEIMAETTYYYFSSLLI